jgi:FkbM family methyltransferase
MELSYTQNMEDYHLWLALGGDAPGTYIDVGGGHPIAGNVSFWFYERGWHGIVIEPQRDLAALYEKLRPRDRIVTNLIGQMDGEAEFYQVERLHGLSTTVRNHAERAKDAGAGYRIERMPMSTLSTLCQQHGCHNIDFLKIDVEGGEANVLAGADFKRFRPKVIVIEAIEPLSNRPSWNDWEPQLLAQGYQFALFDTLNRFYVAEEHPDIRARLPSDRAPWDAVRHMYEIGRAPENPKHPDHVLAQELTRAFWAHLPRLSPETIASLLASARGTSSPDEFASLLTVVESEPFRCSLGRIACGYDGGQVD